MQIFRAVVAIMAALTAATGIILDTLQITGIDTKWWTAGAFMVFCIFVIWIIADLNSKNKELVSKHPSISVISNAIDDLWYLEVTNKGATGIFSAEVCVFSSEQNNEVGGRYNALWGNTNTDRTEIMNGHSDIIRLASITYTDTEYRFIMKAYDTANKGIYLIKHMDFKKSQGLKIQVVISSNPKLKDGAFVRDYCISSTGITESEPKRRLSIPDKYLFGELDEDSTEYFEAKSAVENLRPLKIFDDSKAGDTIKVFYSLRDKLAIGISENEASVQDRLVLAQLSLHKIVQLEQRRKSSFGSAFDEGYWVLTELGKRVVLYLQAHKYILES